MPVAKKETELQKWNNQGELLRGDGRRGPTSGLRGEEESLKEFRGGWGGRMRPRRRAIKGPLCLLKVKGELGKTSVGYP